MIDFINNAIQVVADGVGAFIEILPTSPFRAITEYFNNSISGVPNWLSMLNWFIPMAEIVAMLEAWGLSIALWYAISIALRWLKAVQ